MVDINKENKFGALEDKGNEHGEIKNKEDKGNKRILRLATPKNGF